MSRPPQSRAVGTADLSQQRPTALVPVVVEATDGPGQGARCELERGTLTVGRGTDCDLVLDDPAVSRKHLTLELLEGAVLVRDLGSKSGTRYLGARVHQATVPVGGAVEAGKTTLRFRPRQADGALDTRDRLGELVGRSPAMRRLFPLIERAAATDTTVLLWGETGTGKDVVARTLHALSPRANRPFVTLDCGALSAGLLESELFGHARGAFTGAVEARAGLFETALDGTLFLDEVGELPLEQQTKLLRVLEARTFRRVGESLERKFSGRVIAATRRDLSAEVREKRFREDLYFRLAVVVLTVPALRERREDIPVLAELFAARRTGAPLSLAPETLAAMQVDRWPGNVRELKNAVERVLALGASAHDEAGAPPAPVPRAFARAREHLLLQVERDFLVSLLERHQGNVSAAAREAEISRRQLHRLLAKHHLHGGGE